MNVDEPSSQLNECEREKQIDAEIERDLKEIEKDTHEVEMLEKERRELEHHHRKVTVTVDNKPKEIEPGKYVVSVFKDRVGVPANYELEQVKDGRLTPLDDSSEIEICGGEVFVSHVRRGGSSHD